MNSFSKFDQLSLKTDRDLVTLATHELDLGFRSAFESLTNAENSASVDDYRRAKHTFQHVLRLIALISELSADQRAELKSRLARFGAIVEALSATEFVPAPSEEKIARLARAMWEARGRVEGKAERDWLRAEQILKSRAGSCVDCVAV